MLACPSPFRAPFLPSFRSGTALCGVVLAATILLATPARPQCPGWDPAFGASPANGVVQALHVFDDGRGPALYAGGTFDSLGGVPATNVARWDGATWSPVGAIDGHVSSFATHDDGGGEALYAGGGRTTGGWQGVVWRWNGAVWTQVGATVAERQVYAIASFDDGAGAKLYASRWGFLQFPPTVLSSVARFDGASWTDVLSPNGLVNALTVHDDGLGPRPALFVGGGFTSVGSPSGSIASPGLVRWDGANLSPLPVSGGAVGTLHVFDDGSGPALYIGGGFTAVEGVPAKNVAKRTGGSWSPLGSGVGSGSEYVRALAGFFDGAGPAVYAAGNFTSAGGSPASNVARWDGAGWSAVGTGFWDNSVLAAAAFDDGVDGDRDLYVGGYFVIANSIASGLIARWEGCATEAFCFGDGSLAPCPCANTGASGHGCENSAATGGALLAASGSADADSVVLTSSGELSTALSIFLQGNVDLTSTSGAVVFGDGVRCVGGALKRLYVANAIGGVVSAPNAGDPSIQTRSATLGDPIASGSTRWYQVYYRDPNLAFCPAPSGDGFNVSSGLRIVW